MTLPYLTPFCTAAAPPQILNKPHSHTPVPRTSLRVPSLVCVYTCCLGGVQLSSCPCYPPPVLSSLCLFTPHCTCMHTKLSHAAHHPLSALWDVIARWSATHLRGQLILGSWWQAAPPSSSPPRFSGPRLLDCVVAIVLVAASSSNMLAFARPRRSDACHATLRRPQTAIDTASSLPVCSWVSPRLPSLC